MSYLSPGTSSQPSKFEDQEHANYDIASLDKSYEEQFTSAKSGDDRHSEQRRCNGPR